MALRAVVFDYGMVLTGEQAPTAYAELLRITGLTREAFEPYYWADRLAYDEGKLTGVEFWQKIVRDAGLNLPAAEISELNLWDARMWSTENHDLIAWQLVLKQRGLLTGILSNMGDYVHDHLVKTHAWIQRFDVKVWSYQLLLAKPDPAIYLYTLKALGTRPEETLFLDDKLENVQAARALGMKSLVYSTMEQLRADLVATGLDAELPLP